MDIPQRDMEGGQNGILRESVDVQLSGHTNDDSAAITRLPDEVLAEIFHQGHISCRKFNMTFRSLVCLVTRHWREVAVDTSSLWTHLAVLPHQTPEYVEMYLRRSKGRPLTIYFFPSPRTTPETLHPILPLLIPSAHRWRRLDINAHKHKCLQLILWSLRDLKAPLLESMFVAAWFHPPSDIANRIFGGGAPRLQSVYLGGVSLRRCWPPLANVTTFHINNPCRDLKVTQFYEMLQALPSVTTLILEGIFPEFDPTNIKKITIPSIRRLMVHAGDMYLNLDPDETHFQHILTDAISVPNVETLVISGGVYEYISDAFASVVSSPWKFSALTSFQLWDSYACSMTRELLTSLPGIQELTFIRSGSQGVKLCLDETGPVLLPRLHMVTYQPTLTFDIEDQPAADREAVDLVCSLVAARARLRTPIKKLRVHSDMYTVAPERLRWLREQVQVEKDDFAAPFWRQ